MPPVVKLPLTRPDRARHRRRGRSFCGTKWQYAKGPHGSRSANFRHWRRMERRLRRKGIDPWRDRAAGMPELQIVGWLVCDGVRAEADERHRRWLEERRRRRGKRETSRRGRGARRTAHRVHAARR